MIFKPGDKVKYIGGNKKVYTIHYIPGKIYEVKLSRLGAVYVPCEEALISGSTQGLWNEIDLNQYFIPVKIEPLARLPHWW